MRKAILAIITALLSASPVMSAGIGGQGSSFQWGQLGLPSCGQGMVLYNNNGAIGCEDAPATLSLGIVRKLAGSNNSTQIYGTGVTTHTVNAYQSSPLLGAAVPSFLQAGQVYFVNFPAPNTGPATENIAGTGIKSIMILDSLGTLLTMVGGEIVAGPGILYFDGTEFIYTTFAGPSNIPVSGATAVTQGNFANRDTFYLTAGGETLTLPCSTALSANDQIVVFSTNGTATIDVAASPCTDNILKNGTTSAVDQTIAQGAAAAIILTDGAGNFFVSGS